LYLFNVLDLIKIIKLNNERKANMQSEIREIISFIDENIVSLNIEEEKRLKDFLEKNFRINRY